jgi:pimeloyl-ACP methyl ester carboxylesterase
MSRRFLPIFAVGLLFLPAWARAGAPEIKKPNFDSGGVKIHYVIQGKEDGEPVLLIHGYTADIERGWSPVITALKKDYQVIAMDCRGHGGSEKPHDPKKYGVEMVEDAVRLLDHLKIKKAHIVGYSMGASIALQIVVRHPERVRSAVLGGNGMPSPGVEKFFSLMAESLEKGNTFGPLIVALTPKDRPKPSDEQIKKIDAQILANNDPKALAAVARGMASKELALSDDAIKSIKTPMIALIGEIDPLKTRVDDLKNRLPALQVVVIPMADHITAMTHKEFVSGIKEFLDKHGPAQK